MISLHTLFWLMIVMFGAIGMLRGWTKEIVATSGLVLSLFAQLWFGYLLVGVLAGNSQDAMKTQFYIRAFGHIIFAFFAYQGPTMVRPASGGRVGERARGTIQASLLGFIVGGLNGYLIVGALWSFLEFNIGNKTIIQYPLELPYPFPEAIIRPLEGPAFELISKLPFPLLQTWLPLLVIILFLFVIIAMI